MVPYSDLSGYITCGKIVENIVLNIVLNIFTGCKNMA